MISNRNIINLILEIKKQVLQPYHCLIDTINDSIIYYILLIIIYNILLITFSM